MHERMTSATARTDQRLTIWSGLATDNSPLTPARRLQYFYLCYVRRDQRNLVGVSERIKDLAPKIANCMFSVSFLFQGTFTKPSNLTYQAYSVASEWADI